MKDGNWGKSMFKNMVTKQKRTMMIVIGKIETAVSGFERQWNAGDGRGEIYCDQKLLFLPNPKETDAIASHNN